MTKHISVEEVNSNCQATPGICSSGTRDLIKNWCASELQWVAYMPGCTPRLWAQVTRQVRGYLGVLWVMGTLRGDRPREAFSVRCDQTTMTEDDIREGHVVCQVGFAPAKPSEFVYYRLHIRLQTLPRPLAAVRSATSIPLQYTI